MAINAARKARMSNQIMEAATTASTKYLIQYAAHGEWRCVGDVYKTPEDARSAALNSNTSPVPMARKWRIVRSISTWETVDTSGM